jgi:hypothetical protein
VTRAIQISIALVVLAALVVLVRRDVVESDCPTGTCIVVEGDDDTSRLGVTNVGHVTANGYSSVCRLVVRRPDGPSGVGFRGATVASPGYLTILDGAVGRVRKCSGDPQRARAVIDLNPAAYAWAIPEPGHVFVPFDDEWGTMLPDYSFAEAMVGHDGSGRRIEGSYCIVTGHHGGATDTQCDVHVGDSFPWGSRRAEIVRIIAPEFPFTGWMEVALR